MFVTTRKVADKLPFVYLVDTVFSHQALMSSQNLKTGLSFSEQGTGISLSDCQELFEENDRSCENKRCTARCDAGLAAGHFGGESETRQPPGGQFCVWSLPSSVVRISCGKGA